MNEGIKMPKKEPTPAGTDTPAQILRGKRKRTPSPKALAAVEAQALQETQAASKKLKRIAHLPKQDEDQRYAARSASTHASWVNGRLSPDELWSNLMPHSHSDLKTGGRDSGLGPSPTMSRLSGYTPTMSFQDGRSPLTLTSQPAPQSVVHASPVAFRPEQAKTPSYVTAPSYIDQLEDFCKQEPGSLAYQSSAF
jgi:hypothetical protein